MAHRFGLRALVGKSTGNIFPSSAAATAPFKLIQTGTITVADGSATGTTTLATTVVSANSYVVMNAFYNTLNAIPTDDPSQCLFYVELTSDTVVTATKGYSSAGVGTVAYTVVEFNPGIVKSKQTGVITMGTGDASKTATITSVDVNKAYVPPQGWTDGTTANWDATFMSRLWASTVLTSATVVTLQRALSATFAPRAPYTVMEFE